MASDRDGLSSDKVLLVDEMDKLQTRLSDCLTKLDRATAEMAEVCKERDELLLSKGEEATLTAELRLM